MRPYCTSPNPQPVLLLVARSPNISALPPDSGLIIQCQGSGRDHNYSSLTPNPEHQSLQPLSLKPPQQLTDGLPLTLPLQDPATFYAFLDSPNPRAVLLLHSCAITARYCYRSTTVEPVGLLYYMMYYYCTLLLLHALLGIEAIALCRAEVLSIPRWIHGSRFFRSRGNGMVGNPLGTTNV